MPGKVGTLCILLALDKHTRRLTRSTNLPLRLKITLVRYNNDREVVLVFHLKVSSAHSAQPTLKICWWKVEISSKEFRDVIEYTKRKPSPDSSAFVRPYRKRTSPHVLLSHRTVLLLTSRIQYVKQSDLVVNDALLAVGVLDRRVISESSVAIADAVRRTHRRTESQ